MAQGSSTSQEPEQEDDSKKRNRGLVALRLPRAPRKLSRSTLVRRGLPRPFDRPRARRRLFSETSGNTGSSPLPKAPAPPQRKSSRSGKGRMSAFRFKSTCVPRRLVFDDVEANADSVMNDVTDNGDDRFPDEDLRVPPPPNAPKKRKIQPAQSVEEESMEVDCSTQMSRDDSTNPTSTANNTTTTTITTDTTPEISAATADEVMTESDHVGAHCWARVSTPASAPLPSLPSFWNSPASGKRTRRRRSDGPNGNIRKRLQF